MSLLHCYLLHILFCCAASAVRVTGSARGHVTLPCHLTEHQMNTERQSHYPQISVRWRRDNMTLVRVTPSGVTFMARSVNSRVFLYQNQFELGIFSLHLDPVEQLDVGTYSGQIHYGKIRHQCTVMLGIISVIQSPPGFLYEGSSVTLTCSGKGLMAFHNTVRWQHGGAPVHPSTRLSVKATMLHIEGLSEDDGGEWSCDHDGARASHKLRVIAISGPDDLSVYSTVGSHVELPCKMTEVFDKTVVSGSWMRVTGSRDQFTNLQMNENWEKLVMYPVTPIDAGIYRCQVTHAQHQMVKRVHLKVMQVSPSGPGYIREGTALQLLCSVSGTEGDEHYEWRGPSPHHQVQWGRELKLPSVRLEDAGAWNCSIYVNTSVVGNVGYLLHVHAPLTGSESTRPGVQIYLPVAVLILLVVTVSAVCLHQRKRRLLQLTALSQKNSLSPPKEGNL